MTNRLPGIGGTDIAKIMGVSPWGTAFDVYCDKLGLVDPPQENRAMRLGKRFEPVLLEEYTIETGLDARPWQQHIRHPDIEIAVGTPDAMVTSAPIGIETKTAGIRQAQRWGEPGSDQIPEEYVLQACWYAAITDFDRWDVAVLIGGQDFRVYLIQRNRELEGLMLEAAQRFWRDHILTQTPPAIDGSASAREYIERTYRRNTQPLRIATPEETLLLSRLSEIREQRKIVETQESELETLVKAAIRDSEGLEWDGGRVTWRASKDRSDVDWEAVARSLGATPEVVKQYTLTKPGSRRFLLRENAENV